MKSAMSPRLSLWSASRGLAIRVASRPSMVQRTPISVRAIPARSYSDKPKPHTNPSDPENPAHVSEEAAQVAEIMGETKPDLSQGTPVQEILERDPELNDKAPEILKDKKEKKAEKVDQHEKAAAAPDAEGTTFDNLMALGQIEAISQGGEASDITPEMIGHKFPLPDLPLPPFSNRKERYDPIVDQVTNLMMKHGRLSAAQRHMSFILNHLRTAPPPKINPLRPLLPGSPPAAALPLDPIKYLTLAIDSVAPLMKIKKLSGAAGGGQALLIPSPLSLRQRRRTAIMWIIDTAAKKNSKGSGRGLFAQKVADEVVSVVEGKSGAWDKRALAHKMATANRTNLNYRKPKASRG